MGVPVGWYFGRADMWVRDWSYVGWEIGYDCMRSAIERYYEQSCLSIPIFAKNCNGRECILYSPKTPPLATFMMKDLFHTYIRSSIYVVQTPSHSPPRYARERLYITTSLTTTQS
jgi:hypothetical protein